MLEGGHVAGELRRVATTFEAGGAVASPASGGDGGTVAFVRVDVGHGSTRAFLAKPFFVPRSRPGGWVALAPPPTGDRSPMGGTAAPWRWGGGGSTALPTGSRSAGCVAQRCSGKGEFGGGFVG